MCVSSVSSDDELSKSDLIHEQGLDNECSSAKLYIEGGKRHFDVSKLGSLKRHRKHLHIVDNILKWKDKWVIPKSLQNTVMELCHSHPMSGHFGSERTYQRFSKRYFWSGAPTDASNFVGQCQKCNEFNPPRTAYVKAPLQPIETVSRFELVCYDLAGPFLPKTIRGNSYALIVIDHFTHWPEFVALPDIKAPTIATALFDNWCCRYGNPSRFHSDGASNVHGDVLKELCKRFGVKKSKSSRLHPQGDGMSEIFVRQLKSCIQKQVQENGSDWDLFLQPTAFAIRSNIAHNTKFSPAELIFGDKLVQPIDHLIDNPHQTYSQKQGSQFAKELKSRIKSSEAIVNTNLHNSRKQMKQQYDKRANSPSFEVNDTVMLWKPYKKKGISGCFQPPWYGPWTLVRFTGRYKTNCTLVNCKDPEKKINVHVNQLKLRKGQSGITHVNNDNNNTTQPKTNTNTKLHFKNSNRSKGGCGVDPFLHYLDDLKEEDGPQAVPQGPAVDLGVPAPVPAPAAPAHPQIDQRWVSLDADNIIDGERRTRNRPDYNVLAGNQRR